MRLLLDTHALIWALDLPTRLGIAAAAALRDPNNDLYISAATIWELAIKVGLGKLSLSRPYRTWMDGAIVALGASILPIDVEYADAQAKLPYHHGDPFDRLLIAQALVEGMAIIGGDPMFDNYGVTRIW